MVLSASVFHFEPRIFTYSTQSVPSADGVRTFIPVILRKAPFLTICWRCCRAAGRAARRYWSLCSCYRAFSTISRGRSLVAPWRGTYFAAKSIWAIPPAIVAASNAAGGAGSVVGDTTTTMMWVAGSKPKSVLKAYVAATVALLIFAIPAALQQERHAPIVKHARRGLSIDWARVFIVAAMLIVALVVNVVTNLHFPATAWSRSGTWSFPLDCVFVTAPLRRPDWGILPDTFKGTIFRCWRWSRQPQ